ncbi:MAG TPA: GNAT family N-acetyltransferase, partial [Parvularculaceae bacterium]|nr:GNAT family N-acetyltransferase [Parvularculaceae bacterium]
LRRLRRETSADQGGRFFEAAVAGDRSNVTEGFRLRPATTADIEPMRALERRAAQKFREVGYDFCADGPVREAAEHQRVMTEGQTLIAESPAGAAAGFAMFEPLDGAVHLVEIDVDPDFQNRGVARALIAAGEDWARDGGFDEMTLTTYRDVPWNAPFYRRLGFVAFDPEPARKGLLKTIEQEAAWGFAFAPRTPMRKRLI